MGNKWTAADIADRSSRTGIVTAANSGPGYDTTATRGEVRAGARNHRRRFRDADYRPDGLGEAEDGPKLVAFSEQWHDQDIQRRVWTRSEELTGQTWPL